MLARAQLVCHDRPVEERLARIEQKLDALMAVVQSWQEVLDTYLADQPGVTGWAIRRKMLKRDSIAERGGMR